MARLTDAELKIELARQREDIAAGRFGSPPQTDLVKMNALKMQQALDAARSYDPSEPFDAKAYTAKARADMKYNR
ncbi:hypothetical protein [Mesorhizobium sp.]|uniref:hypothetical protein n=1 Tax=Mesorhizobium sp. TaxID=1871066 RepID=UPI000FE6B083|nr:hypothetical protein [Mesorhizobium sp.]RWO89547.1 MAG: hypothetical protein EOQ96_05145 [Mesorhizobium sp.]